MRGVAVGSRNRQWTCVAERLQDDVPLRVYRWGPEVDPQRPAIALIHGMEEGWDVWSEVCSRLSGRFRWYALDLPWHGREGYRWTQLHPTAAWIRFALELLPEPVQGVMAHSLGANGFLEHLHAKGHPELKALVLVSPFYRAKHEQFDWAMFTYYVEHFRRLLEHGLRVRTADRALDPAKVAAMAEVVHERIGPLGWMEFFNLFIRTPGLNLDQVSMPTLVLGGEHDFASFPFGNYALSSALPHGDLITLPDCGHFCMLECPDQIAAVTGDFLTKCCAAEPRVPIQD